MIEAPWTPEHVAKLNEYQACGWVHEFTCGTKEKHAPNSPSALIASADGWRCPSCDYRQTWAHEHMLNGAPANPLISLPDAPSLPTDPDTQFAENAKCLGGPPSASLASGAGSAKPSEGGE